MRKKTRPFLDRAAWLERTSRWLARRRPAVPVRLARDLVDRSRSLTRTTSELDRELETLSAQIAPALLELPGCGGLTAAKLLAEIGPIGRFRTDAHGGVAPLQASAGRTQRQRLDRGGTRQLNYAHHRIAVTQSRIHPPARAYLERKQSEGKSATRSTALPQSATRTHRLHSAQERAAIDIGATRAHPTFYAGWWQTASMLLPSGSRT